MKVLLILTTCLLVSGANANGFTDFFHQLGNQLTTAFAPLVDQGKQLAGTLLTTATQAGTQLAGQALSTLASSLLHPGSLSAATTASPVFQRSLLSGVLDHVGSQVKVFEQHLKDEFGNLQQLTHAGLDKLHHLAQTIGLPDFDPHKLAQQVQTVVQTHSGLVDGVLGNVVNHVKSAVQNVLATVHHDKRSFSDTLQSVGASLASFFQPHLQAVKNVFSGVGNAVVQAGHQVAAQLSQSVSQLGTKLQGHLGALNSSGHAILQHGTNALSALKDAVSDILQQTLTNIQPHVQNIVNTGKSALGVATQHIAHTLGGLTNQQATTAAP